MKPTKHELYHTWAQMRARCRCENHTHYKSYGGRGIKVCARWDTSFRAFIEDMGPRPKGFTVERINNDGDYEPENCRWASRSEQARNRGDTRTFVFNGEVRSLSELCEWHGIEPSTVTGRSKKGATLEEALQKPLRWSRKGIRWRKF